jgi:hypothetical protein
MNINKEDLHEHKIWCMPRNNTPTFSDFNICHSRVSHCEEMELTVSSGCMVRPSFLIRKITRG